MKRIAMTRWLALALALCSVSCDSKTYVIVGLGKLDTITTPIHTIELGLKLGEAMDMTLITEPGGGAITFPTDAALLIRHGSGPITIAATAKDMTGTVVARAGKQGVVATGQTLRLDLVFGGGEGLLQADRDRIDFGDVAVGSPTPATTVKISNAGGGATGPITVKLDGAGAANFALGTTDCQALDAGASCNVDVIGQPAAGAAEANLIISAAPGGSVTVALAANGIAAGDLKLTPALKDFGSVATGDSALFDFTVTNSGTIGSGAITANVSGSQAAEFVVQPGGCSGNTLAPSATCTLSIKFSPTAAGSRVGSLTVSATPGGGAVASLSGTGLPPGKLSLSVTNYDFGMQMSPTGTATTTIDVINNGGGTSGPVALSFTGTDGALFTTTTDGCTGMTLAGGARCTVTVKFTASSVGAKMGTFTATASPGGTASATLTGTGVAASALEFMPAAKDFGEQTAGMNPVQSFTLKNNGGTTSGTITMSTIGVAATSYVIGVDTCSTTTLSAGNTCTVEVNWMPMGGAGSKSAQLRAAVSSGNPAFATLSGKLVTATAITASPTSWNFGSLTVGSTSAQKTIAFTNCAACATSAALTVAISDAQFEKISDTCTGMMLPGGGSCSVDVDLKSVPQQGAKTANLVVGGATVALSGSVACSTDGQCSGVDSTKPYCDTGVCTAKKPKGRTCSMNTDCNSNFCADGYCCNTSCLNQCTSCAETGSLGTCVNRVGNVLTGSTPSRTACTGGLCGGTCNGVSPVCAYPGALTACGGTSCAGTTLTTPGTCNGSGTCNPTTQVCSGTTPTCNAADGKCSYCVAVAASASYKRVFLTSQVYKGNASVSGGPDAICASAATARSLGGTWKAYVTTSSSSPATTFTQASVNYVLLDGTVVANGWSDLTDGSLDHAINIYETCMLAPSTFEYAWVGGTTANCSDFTDGNGSTNGGNGDVNSSTSTWSTGSLASCNSTDHFYCFEQ